MENKLMTLRYPKARGVARGDVRGRLRVGFSPLWASVADRLKYKTELARPVACSEVMRG